jgi:hypothetical protein
LDPNTFTASFVLDLPSPLAPNTPGIPGSLTDYSAFLLSWSTSDGIITFDNTTPLDNVTTSFRLATGSAGEVTDWQFLITGTANAPGSSDFRNFGSYRIASPNQKTGGVDIQTAEYAQRDILDDFGSRQYFQSGNTSTGTWSVVEEAGTPEPVTWTMALLGFSFAMILGRRQVAPRK